MKTVFSHLAKYKKESIVAPLFKLLEASFELFVPLVVAKIIDIGIVQTDKVYIIKMCLLLVALAVAGLGCSVTAQYFAARAATGSTALLRHSLFEKLLSLDYAAADKLGTAAMLTRMTGDINQVQTGINLTLRLLLRSPFVVFGAAIMAFTVDARSAIIFVIVIPLLCVAVFTIMLRSIPLYKKVQTALDGLTLILRENLTGVRVLRAFNKEKQQQQNFEQSNDSLTAVQLFAGRISAVMNPLTFVIINAGIIALIYVGALRADSGKIKQGEVVALYNYMSQILVELVKLANLIITVTKAVASAKRIEGVLILRGEKSGSITELPPTEIAVEFKNVSFKYENAAAESLKDISFKARRSQTIGIIGATGSGKTTLINLIPDFYAATDGVVEVNGINVNEIDKAVLRRKTAVVSQSPLLFSGTIRENLLWGNSDATDEELLSALQLAQAEDIIKAKEKGLDSVIEQGGTNLSGGQRQRLAIARALVKRPEILILDDSTSALDFATEAALKQALSDLPFNPVVFAVSQRTSCVMGADLIIVLNNGSCIAAGTHTELLESCSEYCEIYQTQFGGVK